jgi:tetratricopeptide (TPR) repeat protein
MGEGANGTSKHATHLGKLGVRPKPAKEPRRREGVVAEEAQLRARVDLAHALGDPAEERVAAKQLAEHLAGRGAEIDHAVELAFKALATRDDPPLRHALAGWLEGLGEPGLAASELRKLAAAAEGASACAILVRIGVLHARAGDSLGAQEAFAEAAEHDPLDALPLELLGAAAAAFPQSEGFPSPRIGAEAYVQAARRRAGLQDTEGEIENLLRAFELDPTSPLAAAALISAYNARGKTEAADHVFRTHGGAEVHERRRMAALEAGQTSRALAAALDEGLDGVLEGQGADVFDGLLAKVGAYEPLAVRLELRAEHATSARRWAELGRLLAGPLAASERAVEAYARAVAVDPSDAESMHALKAHTQKLGDPAWLIEALIRGVMGSASAEARLAAARELASVAESKADPLLSAWAYRATATIDPSDERARAAATRLEDAVRRHEEELALARRAVETSAAEGRSVALYEVVRLARSLPDESKAYSEALLELAEDSLVPRSSLDAQWSAPVEDETLSSGGRGSGEAGTRDETIFAEACRVAERVGDNAGIARIARARLDARGPNVRVRGLLVAALRRKGDLGAAADACRAFAEESATRWTCSVAWITAAVANERETRGRALAAIAPTAGISTGGAIAVVAAEILADLGLRDVAKRAAELASRSEEHQGRAFVVLAKLVNVTDGRLAQATIEKAIEVCGIEALWCERLSEVLALLGDSAGAVRWARRRVALRPGEPAAAQALVDRAVRAGDAVALADALAWLAPQPQPSRSMAERIAPALEALTALDVTRAAAIGRRALDVLGPRSSVLRKAIGAVPDPRLHAVLLERWLAAGAPAAERGPLLLEIAAAYEQSGEVDAEIDALARAAREGASLLDKAPRLDALQPNSPDAELAYLEAIAALRVDQKEDDKTADAFRDLGAALWDMADDRPRAVQAWLRAAQYDTAYGYATLRADLASFADAQYAVDCLSELVDREKVRVRSGVIATQAAKAALQVRAFARALGLAKIALERDPGHADALETAELACRELARVPEMSGIYDQVARRARGRFGRRAAHHRAARFFEAGNVVMLALKHAAQAFIAVPSEGSTLLLLQRTAKKAQREGVAVRTVEHVAELARGKHARAAWLHRAASMTTTDLDGTRQKLDLLLKATILVPTPGALELLAEAARAIVTLAPEDDAAVALRLERAGEQLAKDLEGPDGARIGITFVRMAVDLFKDGEWAWRALERSIAADADVDEYLSLVPFAGTFAAAPGAAEALQRMIAEVEKPYSNVGHALFRLTGAIARDLGDQERSAKLFVRAAEKDSDDDQIVVEADDAIVASQSPALLERLNKRAGNFRRTEALRAIAAKALERGTPSEAVRRLERASEIAAPEQRPDVARELSEALVKAGRGEDAVLRELGRDDITNVDRAQRWVELAKIRQDRGDNAGAADALLQAATEEPTAERWSAVEQAAESAGRDHVRVEALAHLARLAEAPAARLAILKKLAQIEGGRGSLTAAETAWRQVMEIDPDDLDADAAIEALLVSRGSHDELAEHMGERAARLMRRTAPEDRDKLRAVRLRRAAILEQRLGRLEEACAELELVLADQPGNPSALRWLADLWERAGEPQKALPPLERLWAGTSDDIEFVTLGVRRVRALLASGDVAKAQHAVADLVSRTPNVLTVAEARVEVARAAGNAAELGNALVELARISVEEPRVRSELLVEAAQAAARSGDREGSLARARDAARLAPDVAATQLFARGLEYRLRGAGTPDEARATIASLERLHATPGPGQAALEPDDIALRAFLIAEATDVVSGVAAGEAVLKRVLSQIGAQPLVALGLAERAAKAGRHEEAYRFYTEAVYGNLLGLRRPGRVALAAAESASLAGDLSTTQRFLGEAAKDPETRPEALRRVSKIALSRGELARAKPILRELADSLSGKERAEVLAELGRALCRAQSPADRLEGDRTMREAVDAAAGDADLEASLRAELEALRGRIPTPQGLPAVPMPAREPPPAPPPVPERAMVVPDARLSIEIPGIPRVPPQVDVTALDDEAIQSIRHPPLGSNRPPPEPAAVEEPAPPPVATISEIPTTPAGKVAKAKARLINKNREEAEKLLTDALREGSIEAADMLDTLLKDEPSQRAALLKVRRQAVELAPGNTQRLVALREAARADQNTNYVRAIDHVLRAFDPAAGPLPPPPLVAQNAQPGMLTLLTRHSHEAGGEAFGVAWEGASAIFAKSPSAAGLTGLERIVAGGTTPLSRLYEVALRLLDPPRFTLFHKRNVGLGAPQRGELPLAEAGTPLSMSIALVTTPSAVLSGDASEDTAELRSILGASLSAVLPQNALILGLPEADARSLWNVLLGAFGPPGIVTVDRKDAHLADMLWQTLAPRTQRRLKELLGNAEATPFELVSERARQSGRRVGMFLTGDFGHAARAALKDFPQVDPQELERPGGLEKLAKQLPAIADLLRLAIRPEYADARWHQPSQAAQRLATGKLRPV